VFTKNTTIPSLLPTITGTVLSYGISPSLPSGLSFNTSTGIISGTPTAISPPSTYTVTANTSGGSSSFGVVIAVNDVVPNSLSYPSPNVFTKNTTIPSLLPTITGTVLSYEISPSLPSGLSFNTSTGIISGTPTAISPPSTYTVTANTSGGSSSFGVVITVNSLEIKDVEDEKNLLILPNPNNGSFLIMSEKSLSGGIVLIEVFNAIGILIYSESIPEYRDKWNKAITLPSKSSGMYILKLSGGELNIFKTIMIQ
jgi:hypothetical protein